MNNPLQGQSFIITRPKAQGIHLKDKIEKLGGRAFLYPTLEIENWSDHPSLKQAIKKLDQYDFAIFISANAAEIALPLWPKNIKPPKIIAIGPGTAKRIREFHFNVDYLPKDFSSEGLLDLPILQQLKNKQLIIFCGENSRPYLKDQLVKRGAKVNESICYRRQRPSPEPFDTQKNTIQCIITTSKEGLENLFHFSKESLIDINGIPILIISENMRLTLHELNFHHPYIIANNAMDESIIDALLKNFAIIEEKKS